MKQRGISLGSTLLVVSLVACLGMAMASLSMTHLNLSSRTLNAARARDLARAVTALAIERIQSDPTFGTEAGQERTLTVAFAEDPAGDGWLSFDQDEATLLGRATSLNNLAGASSVTAPDGRVVPAEGVYLVAVGTFRGVSRRVVTMLHVPAFPYAAASDGPIISQGNLLVGAVEEDAPAPGTPEDLLPANLLSNAPGDGSMVLGPDSTITGDLLAAGAIELDGTEVLGQVLPHADPQPLPRIALDDYDPLLTGQAFSALEGSYSSPDRPLMFSGVLRRQGDVVIEADVDLRGAVLFVDGNVTIRGGLEGRGLLASTGSLTVERHTDMQAGDQLALLVGGKVDLRGRGRHSSTLRGLVYSEGGLEARQLTLRGTLISNRGEAAEGSQVQLEQAALLRDDTLTRVAVDITKPPSPTPCVYLLEDGTLLRREDFPGGHDSPEQVPGNAVLRIDALWNDDGTLRAALRPIPLDPQRLFASDQADPTELAVTVSEYARDSGLFGDGIVFSVEDILAFLGAPPQAIGGVPGGIVTVDPSELLTLADKIRLVYWRED